MKLSLPTVILSVLPCLFCTAQTMTCGQLQKIHGGAPFTDPHCEVTGRTTLVFNQEASTRLVVEDDSGAISLVYTNTPPPDLCAGDLIRTRVKIVRQHSRGPYFISETVQRLAPGVTPQPRDVSAADLLDGKCDFRLVRVQGTIRDVIHDENDPRFIYLVLLSGERILYVAFRKGEGHFAGYRTWIGAEASVVGSCEPHMFAHRMQLGPTLQAYTPDNVSVRPLDETTRFAVPCIDGNVRLSPSRIPLLGRRRLEGLVIASWDGRRLILRTPSGHLSNVLLKDPRAPSCGTCVEVAGFPETDLYHVNLVNAEWRPSTNGWAVAEKTWRTDARSILFDAHGNTKIDPAFHGRTVQIEGVVRSLSAAKGNGQRIVIENAGQLVALDVSNVPALPSGLEVGYTVRVTGVCVLETDNWDTHSLFPRTSGFFLVARKPGDLVLLRARPWWTTGKLLAVIGSLAAVLLACLWWSAALRRLAERRGRELADESMARARSDIKTLERTRLAVELHDSITQSLTSVSMELKTAGLYREGEQMRQHLDLADKTLDSCLSEMRNCLWDLRSEALEEPDMTSAIRRTLLPHAGDVELQVRFNVARDRFTDNTAHEIMKIIRELTLNGIHHGRATRIRIAGMLEGETLKFSVSDNGCGFDPDKAPGIQQGHFGLEGVRERVRQLHGAFVLESAPAKGTKATVTILNDPEEDEGSPS